VIARVFRDFDKHAGVADDRLRSLAVDHLAACGQLVIAELPERVEEVAPLQHEMNAALDPVKAELRIRIRAPDVHAANSLLGVGPGIHAVHDGGAPLVALARRVIADGDACRAAGLAHVGGIGGTLLLSEELALPPPHRGSSERSPASGERAAMRLHMLRINGSARWALHVVLEAVFVGAKPSFGETFHWQHARRISSRR
jgi:hypothetical protein